MTGTRPGPADPVAALLGAYIHPDPALGPLVIDVPPATAAQVLDLLPVDLATARLNGVQPPMRWLVAVAADLGGRLVGSFVPGRGFARFDGVQVSATAARTLAERVAAAWPTTADAPAALPAATAEAWPSWASDAAAIWTGLGTDLLTQPLPPGTAVAGLWWD